MNTVGFPSMRSARVTGKLLAVLVLSVCMISVGIWLQLGSGGETKASPGDDGGASVARPSGPTLLVRNGNFEADLAGDPPIGWTTYIQPGSSGKWTIQVVKSREGAQWQQTQVFSRDSWGGVRQDVVGLVSGKVYTISGYYRTNSESATASVRYNLHGSTERGATILLAGTSSPYWEEFSDTVTAVGGTITLFLDHNNGKSANKASAFDNIKVIPAQ